MAAARFALCSVLVGLVISVVPASAGILQLPAVQITADGSVIPIPDGSLPYLGDDGLWHFDFRYESTDFSLHTVFTGDPDPSIGFSVTATDFGAPSTFGFLFGTPIVPVVGANVVASSLTTTLTDGGDGLVATTPVFTAEVGFPLTNMGVDLSAPCSGSGVCTPLTAGPIAGPSGSWTFLQTSLSFTLSGGGDTAAILGSASIDPAAPAPEPATVLLLGLGLALTLRRRSRS